jgi:hypothetical protein
LHRLRLPDILANRSAPGNESEHLARAYSHADNVDGSDNRPPITRADAFVHPDNVKSYSPAPIESEVATFAQLQAAISQAVAIGAKLIVALVTDIMFAETLNIDSHVVLHSREGAVLRGGRVEAAISCRVRWAADRG